MKNKTPPHSNDVRELATAFAKQESIREMICFLYDVATPQEIEVLAQRYQIAKLLWTTQLSYQEIARETGASTTTISRVARFLKHEPWGGYRNVLRSIYPEGN